MILRFLLAYVINLIINNSEVGLIDS
jgi:hypothetical protein